MRDRMSGKAAESLAKQHLKTLVVEHFSTRNEHSFILYVFTCFNQNAFIFDLFICIEKHLNAVKRVNNFWNAQTLTTRIFTFFWVLSNHWMEAKKKIRSHGNNISWLWWWWTHFWRIYGNAAALLPCQRGCECWKHFYIFRFSSPFCSQMLQHIIQRDFFWNKCKDFFDHVLRLMLNGFPVVNERIFKKARIYKVCWLCLTQQRSRFQSSLSQPHNFTWTRICMKDDTCDFTSLCSCSLNEFSFKGKTNPSKHWSLISSNKVQNYESLDFHVESRLESLLGVRPEYDLLFHAFVNNNLRKREMNPNRLEKVLKW